MFQNGNVLRNRIKRANIWLSAILPAILLLSTVLFFLVVPPSFAAETTMVVYQQSDGKAFGRETSLDIFDNPELGGQKIVAPFSAGSYSFAVYNHSGSARLPYTLGFTSVNDDGIPLVFSLQKNGVYIYGGESDGEMLPLSELNLSEALLDGKKTDLYTLKWRWDTESDVIDTDLGRRQENGENLTYSLTITATGTIQESAIPKTGDNTFVALWIVICCAALAIMVFLLLYIRRRKKDEDNQNTPENM